MQRAWKEKYCLKHSATSRTINSNYYHPCQWMFFLLKMSLSIRFFYINERPILIYFIETFHSLLHREMSVQMQWQIIQMDNETVGCTDTLTSDRLCPLPCVSAKPQSQAQVFFSIKSLLFVSLVFIFSFIWLLKALTLKSTTMSTTCSASFWKLPEKSCSENECNRQTSHCFDTI